MLLAGGTRFQISPKHLDGRSSVASLIGTDLKVLST